MQSEFVHLHVHSHYSLLDSTVKIPDLMKRAAELGMDAVAVTDHAVLYGAVEMQQKAGGVRPIFGVEINLVPEADEGREDPSFHHLVLLAETLEGYRNLVRLVSMSHMHHVGADGRPRTPWSLLREYAAGLIALTGDIGGEIPRALLRGDTARAEEALDELQALFGTESVFLEIQRHAGIPEQSDACDALIELSRRKGAPLVATNNVHYLREGDHRAHAVLMCIGMDKRIDRGILDRIPLRDLWFKSTDEMVELFEDVPEAIRNTRRIADRCQVEIPLGEVFLPNYPIPDGDTVESYFRQVCEQGLEERFEEFASIDKEVDREAYRERLRTELDIIVGMDFPGYFLIVWDFIRYAREQSIPVGPGRGSGAGSLVAYALRITDLDPIPYGLLFERFLNPERVSMPDFDIDFCQNRRAEVIDYVTRKYGEDNVGLIVTFGQLKARAVVRDVSRVLNFSFADADRLAKLVPDSLKMTLPKAHEEEPRLREAIAEDPAVAFLYETGCALEGNNRNTGLHAAGVVMSEHPLWEYVPVTRASGGELTSQYAKNEVEAAGLVKFDFLGLKTLTVIDDACRHVNAQRPGEKALDFRRISMDDAGVYELIRSGDTTGIFQMESEGFQRLVKQLRPDCFEDIVAAVALYRPGPLGSGMVEQFIDCKHGRREVEYPHPWLEDTLRETYGVMVYQEQVMKVAQILGGFSLGSADLLRRAMGKKKEEEMVRQRARFVEGAATNDIPERQANEIFDLMAHFAGYGFNKSHSAAYAVLTFQTAYLKRYHPTEFYASLMTNDADKTEKVVRYIMDARSRDIAVLPPDVNESDFSFSVSEGRVRFGLGAVKGIGSGPIEAITAVRADQRFESLFDFCERVDMRACQKRVIEALVRVGAFDSLFPENVSAERADLRSIGQWRSRMLAVLDQAVERGARAQADRRSGQSSLFGMLDTTVKEPSAEYPDVPGASDKEVLGWEKQMLGFYVSGHPLDRYRDELKRYADTTSVTLRERRPREEVSLVGVISAVRERPLKSGEGRMAFVTIEDHFGEVEAIVYARSYDEIAPALRSDEPVIARGAVRVEGEGEESVHRIALQEVVPLLEARTRHVKRITFHVDADRLNAPMLERVGGVLERFPGTCRASIRVRFAFGDADVVLPESVGVQLSDDLVRDMEALLGEACTFSG